MGRLQFFSNTINRIQTAFIDLLKGHKRGRLGSPGNSIFLLEGEARLLVVQNDEVLVQSSDVALSHAEFVQRTLGKLPSGAWVGTVRKSEGQIVAINSRGFYGNQLPAPAAVAEVVQAQFE